MRSSDWSSDVCSSDLIIEAVGIALSDGPALIGDPGRKIVAARVADRDEAAIGIAGIALPDVAIDRAAFKEFGERGGSLSAAEPCGTVAAMADLVDLHGIDAIEAVPFSIDLDRICIDDAGRAFVRSVEHTSELQSLMRISYAVFCL